MKKTAFLFPGQGAQYPGMSADFQGENAEKLYALASEITGYDLFKFCADKDNTQINDTKYSQIAIFTASMIALNSAIESGLTPDGAAGHSLGEYTAMAACGMISFEDGCKIVKARGEIMSEYADGGALCAVIGSGSDTISEVCGETEGLVLPVNFNTPVQTVIAGEKKSVQEAAEKLKTLKYRTIMLPVSGAFHTPMMQKAADKFRTVLESVKFEPPRCEFYSNLTGTRMTNFDNMPEYLASHMVSPVLFTDELTAMKNGGFTEYYDVGPSKVLAGMVSKTLKDVTVICLNTH